MATQRGGNYTVYLDEAGTHEQAAQFVVGALWVPQEQLLPLETQLNALCERRGFSGELGYRVVNARNVVAFTEALELLRDMPGLSFHTRSFDKARLGQQLLSSGSLPLGGLDGYRQLLEGRFASAGVYHLRIERRSRTRASLEDLRQHFNAQLGPAVSVVRSIQALDSRISRVLQFCDLLTGCVAASGEGVVQRPAKLQLIHHLHALAGQEQLGRGRRGVSGNFELQPQRSIRA